VAAGQVFSVSQEKFILRSKAKIMAIVTTAPFTGTADDDIILGGAGNDSILGGDGDDIITGAAGNNTIDGGDGNDTINYGSRADVGANYTEGAAGVTVDLGAGTATNSDGGTDTITNVENVRGTTKDDTITGDANDNVITGSGGQDTIVTKEGNDTVVVNAITGSNMDGGDNDLGVGDTLDYSAVTGDLNINLDDSNGKSSEAVDAGNLVDNLAGFENVILGAGSDTVQLEAGVRNIITHTTNLDANGDPTGAAGNGGDDTLNGFQFGNNYNVDGTNNLNATFDVVDLSHVKVPNDGTRTNFVRVTESGGNLVITISASGGLSGGGDGTGGGAVDVTTVTLTGESYASLIADYGMGGGSINSSETALTAMLTAGNIWLGSSTGTPEITSPQEQLVVEEGQSITLKGVNSLKVQDWLSSGLPNQLDLVTVTLDVRNPADPTNQQGVGTLTLGGVIAGVMTDGNANNGDLTGNISNKIVLKGTVAQVNAALADLRYTSAANNQAADQLLRVTIEDADGKKDVESFELIVQARVQNQAQLSVSQTSQLLANGATEANLNLAVSANALDADGSETIKVTVAGVPAAATLDSTAVAHGATIAKDLSGAWNITGTTAQVQAATAALKLTGLTAGDYPMNLSATVTTTDADAEGIHASASKSVSFVIDAYAANVTAQAGKQAVGTNQSENVIGLDAQGDQVSSGSGADKLKAFGTTDSSKNDLVNYSVAPTLDDITQGVDVNLQTGTGRGGHAQGDSYEGFEGAIGTTFNDRFIGATGKRNTFNGGLGNDIFVAKTSVASSAEMDILSGANGSDTVSLERVGAGAIVDLRKANQDFNNDTRIDASLSSIENVITGAGNDTITLVNSTSTVLSGSTTTSGSTNANIVYVNRTDNGTDTVVNFQSAFDKIDLSGVLQTGLSGDLNNYVTLNATGANTTLSIDKNRDGNADTTVTLTGVAAGTWANATAMATAGALVHGLQATVGTATTAQSSNFIEGGRTQVYFDVSQIGFIPPAGAELTFRVGSSLLKYTVGVADTTHDILATSLGAAINAATNLDGQAFVFGTLVEYRLNTLSEAVEDDFSLSMSRVADATTTIAVGGTDLSFYQESVVPGADYTLAKIQIGAANTPGNGGQGWYYGVAYAANNATYSEALAALARNMRALGIDATWDSAAENFIVNGTHEASRLSFAYFDAGFVRYVSNNGHSAQIWDNADATGIVQEGTSDKTGAATDIGVLGFGTGSPGVTPLSITYTNTINNTVLQNISVGGFSDANQVITLAANAVKAANNYWVIDYGDQVSLNNEIQDITTKVGSTVYTQEVVDGNLNAAIQDLVSKINAGETLYQATQVGNTVQLGQVSTSTKSVMYFTGTQELIGVQNGGASASSFIKIMLTVNGASQTYYAANRGSNVNELRPVENLFEKLVHVLKSNGITASWNTANQFFTVENGVLIDGVSVGYVNSVTQIGYLIENGASVTITDKAGIETAFSNVGDNATKLVAAGIVNELTNQTFKAIQGPELMGAGNTAYQFSTNYSRGAVETHYVAKVTVNGVTYYGASYGTTAANATGSALAVLAGNLSNAGINSTWNIATNKLTINATDVKDLGLGFVSAANTLVSYTEQSSLTEFALTEKAEVEAVMRVADGNSKTTTFNTLGAADNANHMNFNGAVRTVAEQYSNYAAALPSVSVSGGLVLNAGVIAQKDVNDATTATVEVNTVTLAGGVVAGSDYSIVINGKTYTVTAANGDTLTTLATKLVASVNADQTAVSEVWHLAINNATVLRAGDVFTVKIGTTDYTYTVKASDTLQTVRDGLLNAINGITSKQVYKVTVDGANLPAAGDTVSVTVDGQVVNYTVQAGDTTALVIAGLRKAVNEVALAKNVTTSLDATGQLVITHHDAANGTFAATGTGVTGTETTGVFGTAPVAGVQASIGNTEGVIKLVSSNAALAAVQMTYRDNAAATPTDVDVTAQSVNKVVAFNAATSSLVTATSAAGVVTLTGKVAGYDVQVSASVKPADVNVLEGAQTYYAYNGVQETFVWRDDAIVGNDVVSGFKIGEDKINLQQVLKGGSTSLADYITVNDSGAAGHVVLKIDADGNAGTTGDRFDITLGGAGTGGVSLASLIDQGSLLAPSALS
jgi:hypothetical protein